MGRLVISTDVRFPGKDKWFTFKYGGYWYYIRFYRGIQLYQFGGKCRKTFKGAKRHCGHGKVIKGCRSGFVRRGRKCVRRGKGKKCSARCNRRGAPVCDNLGHTHGNRCVFNYHKCKNPKLKIAHRGRCKKISGPSGKLITIWLRKLIGWWSWSFGRFMLKSRIVNGGWLWIGKYKTRLVISTDVRFPGKNKWFTFRYGGYWYYIRFYR